MKRIAILLCVFAVCVLKVTAQPELRRARAAAESTYPAAPAIRIVRSASTNNSLFNIPSGGKSTSNHLEVYGTSAYAGATIGVYVDNGLRGTTRTVAGGYWSYDMGLLPDAEHSIFATLTVDESTSGPSAVYDFTIVAGITNLSGSIGENIASAYTGLRWDGWRCETQSNTSGSPLNASTFVPVDPHTGQFTLLPTDIWLGDGSNRSELSFDAHTNDGQTMNITYEFMLSPTDPPFDAQIAPINGWVTLGDIHDSSGRPGLYTLSLGNGRSGDAVVVQYNQNNRHFRYPYVSTSNLARGEWHALDIIVRPGPTGSRGQVWLDGRKIVDVDDIQGAPTYYWKMGIYRGPPGSPPQRQTQTVTYRNFLMRIT